MREIKFRGLTKTTNEFMYGVPLISGTNAFIVTVNERGCDNDNLVYKGSVGQFTGLKDKNGTEIYEGDIVRFCDFLSELTGGNSTDNEVVGVIKYIGDVFLIDDESDTEGSEYKLLMSLINDSEFEVIGNIYEHPHLLEGEDHV